MNYMKGRGNDASLQNHLIQLIVIRESRLFPGYAASVMIGYEELLSPLFLRSLRENNPGLLFLLSLIVWESPIMYKVIEVVFSKVLWWENIPFRQLNSLIS